MTRSTVDLDELSRLCYAAVLSDVCDSLGRRHSTMNPRIGHLAGPRQAVVGWARTVQSLAVDQTPVRHYGREIDFIDSLMPGDFVVATVDGPAAFWGELFSTAAMARGARGVVIDGLIRDSGRIDEVGFPAYGVGRRPTDCLGRISIDTTDEPILCADVLVRSGDLIICDADGVTVVPSDVASEAVERALVKAQTESRAKELLNSGAFLRDAWERFGVL
ncbi:MAG: proA 1 [Pseudonocardiales bacterium]|jgi:regulator of RNase E activity RraA|nr:proA 1 [Pseudonocardiales bacterium]